MDRRVEEAHRIANTKTLRVGLACLDAGARPRDRAGLSSLVELACGAGSRWHTRGTCSQSSAAAPEEAEPLYRAFCDALRELDVEVATGVFGARMAVELVNDGPVTIVLGG